MSGRVLLVGGAITAAVVLAGCSDEPAPAGPPQLRYGQPADVQVTSGSDLVPLRATVQSVERSNRAVLEAGALMVPDLSTQDPWFVRVSYENPTGRDFSGPPQQQFRPRTADGTYATRLDIVSDEPFQACEDPDPAVGFDEVGGTSQACLVVLVPTGQDITSVEWTFPDRRTEAVWRP